MNYRILKENEKITLDTQQLREDGKWFLVDRWEKDCSVSATGVGSFRRPLKQRKVVKRATNNHSDEIAFLEYLTANICAIDPKQERQFVLTTLNERIAQRRAMQ